MTYFPVRLSDLDATDWCDQRTRATNSKTSKAKRQRSKKSNVINVVLSRTWQLRFMESLAQRT